MPRLAGDVAAVLVSDRFEPAPNVVGVIGYTLATHSYTSLASVKIPFITDHIALDYFTSSDSCGGDE